MKILIQSGRVIDPTSGLEAVQDLAIAAGRVARVRKCLQKTGK